VRRIRSAPRVLFAAFVERLRRLPGSRAAARLLTPVTWLMPVAALVLLILWGAEASPQRISLRELTAGELSPMQSWIIVSGNLESIPLPDSDDHQYRLTDPAAPNANLIIQSPVELPVGPSTVSGHIFGGRDGVPAGYTWSARLEADAQLANELPPPWWVFALAGLAVLIVVARRTRYPVFVPEAPVESAAAQAPLQVVAHVPIEEARERGLPRTVRGTLAFDTPAVPGGAELRLAAGPTLPVRLHSSYSTIDVGELLTLRSRAAALRVRAADDDIALAFTSRRDRDRAFSALAAAGR
jgi:hypothetical protein